MRQIQFYHEVTMGNINTNEFEFECANLYKSKLSASKCDLLTALI